MKIAITGAENDVLRLELFQIAKDAGHSISDFSPRDLYGTEDGRNPSTELLEEIADEIAEVDLMIACEVTYGGFKLSSLSYYGLLPEKPVLALAQASSVSGIVASVPGSERWVGWSTLPPIMPQGGTGIIEISRNPQTEDKYFEAAVEFWQSLGLETVEVADGPGLVRARVCSLINEAVSALADGVASAADIDAAMQLGNNYPKGLLAWADELGLDLVQALARPPLAQ